MKESNNDTLDSVTDKFINYIQIISEDATKSLPGHKLYDHGIDVKQGENTS
jgi:hypothetical protein